MNLLTENQKKRLVKNVLDACADIMALNNKGYEFLTSSPGFIAHYDISGFKAHYGKKGLLRDAVLRFCGVNSYRHVQENDYCYQWAVQRTEMYAELQKALRAQKTYLVRVLETVHTEMTLKVQADSPEQAKERSLSCPRAYMCVDERVDGASAAFLEMEEETWM